MAEKKRCTHGYGLGYCKDCHSYVEFGIRVKDPKTLKALNKALRGIF